MAVGRVRNVPVVDSVDALLPRQKLGEDDAFALALVGEHWRTGNVPNRVNPFDRRLHPFVDLDKAAVGELNAQLLDPDVFDDWRAAGGNENLFDFEILLFSTDVNAHGDRSLADFHVADFGARQDIDLPLLEAAGELGAAVGILEREDSGENFDESDLRPEGGEDIGELASNCAGADDRHRLGGLFENQRLVR